MPEQGAARNLCLEVMVCLARRPTGHKIASGRVTSGQMKFRTAIVGTIQALNVHLPAFQAVPEFEVVALCSRNQERVKPMAAKLNLTKVLSDWQALANDPEIDAVALALPANLQGQAALQ